MSTDALCFAIYGAPEDVKGNDLLLLIILADNAFDNGEVYASVDFLKKTTHMSDAELKASWGSLLDKDLLEIIPAAECPPWALDGAYLPVRFTNAESWE